MFQTVLLSVLAGLFARTSAAQQCGEVLHAPATFTSPNYPEPYPSDLACEWEIIAERGIRISLQFLDSFTIESELNCTKDAVIIYDWKEDNYVEMARLCGADLPPKYESTFNKMKVILQTNKETNLRGFKAQWTATCGGHYIASEKEQILYSPGYLYYWPNMSCEYTIQVLPKPTESYDLDVPDEKGIYKFIYFELEDVAEISRDCNNDYLTLQSNNYHSSHKIYEKYCGVQTIPDNYFIEKLHVHFESNKAIEKKGFAMTFAIYTCGGRLTEPTTITASQLNRYPENMNCTWTIEAPQNKKIMVKFEYLNLNFAALCGKFVDYVKLYDGLSADPDQQLAAICGKTNSPLWIPASGNTLTFEFHSNYEGKGFLAEVIFVDPEPIGCGGLINMTYFTSFTLESPKQRSQDSGEYLDCVWNILAPQDHVINFELTSLSFPECAQSNRRKRNVLEIRDGFVPDSLLLGSYCGHLLPTKISSSSNRLSVRMSAIASVEFTAKLTAEKTFCEPVVVEVTWNVTRVFPSVYETGSLARGINCVYEFRKWSTPIHLIIKNLNIQPSSIPGECNKDKIIIGHRSLQSTLGKDYITSNDRVFFTHTYSLFRKYFDFASVNITHEYEFCGYRQSIELYLSQSFFLNLITTPESVLLENKGLEIIVTVPKFCNRNYTEPYGRVVNHFDDSTDTCYTLITAPEGYTISAYFMSYEPYFTESSEIEYMNIYDGNTTESKMITSTKGQVFKPYDVVQPVFSTGRYLLLENIRTKYRNANFDLNYVITNKGRGCGGYLSGDLGVVSSPFYPDWYKEDIVCEFELETPPGTRLSLQFKELDVYGDCENSYLEIVNRDGQVVKKLCEESNYNYISNDNYVKIVSETSSLSTYGTKWFAMFASIL